MSYIGAIFRKLTLQDPLNIATVVKKYRYNCITLSKYFQQVIISKNTIYNNQKLLNNIQSKALIKYINDLTE
jgi:hypothetical protein